MDPELSGWTSASGPETDRLASLISAYGGDLRRVAVAMTGDARRADAAVLATWDWAQRHGGALGIGSSARARLLQQVARAARRRLRAPWHLRLRRHIPLLPRPVPAEDRGRDPAMDTSLASLTVEDRRMLALRYAVGLTTDEIAAQLDLTGPGVRSHLDELREPLRSALGIDAAEASGDALSTREVDQRIAARLLIHLDRRAIPPGLGAVPTDQPIQASPAPLDPQHTARSVERRNRRRPRLRRRPVIVTGIVVLLLAAVILPLALLPGGIGSASGTPTPSPGSLLAIAGWSQRSVARVDGTLEVIGWSPDGRHVAVAQGIAQQIVIYDQQGAVVRTFSGTQAAWVDAQRLLILGSAASGAALVLRTITGKGDLLLSWSGPAAPSGIVAGGGGIAITSDAGGVFWSGQSFSAGLTFSVLRSGAFVPAPAGVPLAWTQDGTRVAYLAAPSLAGAGYSGHLHLLDVATMKDQDLGVTVVEPGRATPGPAAMDPTGRYLLACVAPPDGSDACVLGLVDLADGSVQASSIGGQTATVAWAHDGSAIVEENGTLLRWTPGDTPVATRWQPERGNRVLGMAAAGAWFALGLLKGPASPRLIAGAEPSMVVVSGPAVHSLAASPDGSHLAYGQLMRGSTTIVFASLPAEAPSSPTATPRSSSGPATPAPSFKGAPILSLDQTWTADVTSDGTPVSWGPHVYLPNGGFETSDGTTRTTIPLTLSVLDLTTKVQTPIVLPSEPFELLGSLHTDGGHLVVELGRRLGPPASDPNIPCPSEIAQPVAWRILAAPLGGDGVPAAPFQVLDSGTATRAFTPAGQQGVPCATVTPPGIDVADGLVAYSVEAPSAGNPWATTVVLRRLSDGAVIRRDSAAATVGWLGLSSGMLAWTEEPDASVSSSGVFALRAASPPDAAARTVTILSGSAAPEVGWFVMAGRSVLYTTSDPAAVKPPSIWTLDLDTGSVTAVTPPSGRYCGPLGASGEAVFVTCQTDTQSVTFVSRPGHGWAVLEGTGNWYVVSMGGGWVVLTDWSGQGPRLIGFPLSEVTG